MAANEVDPNATSIQMSGLALGIFATSLSCLCLSTLTVGLRLIVRLKSKAFGIDDGLILAALVLYGVDVGLACHGATVGLGSHTKDLNAFMQVQGLKYLMIWMMIYVIGLMTIKGSICITLFRIAGSSKPYRIAIYSLMCLTVSTFLVTFLGILFYCQPVSANWTGQGTCADSRTMIALSYTSTASTIATDLACAIIPGVMLWDSPMGRSKKFSVMVLLSFGSIASVTTMIRAPYIEHYWTPLDNLQYYTGFIVLLSNLESAIGLIACSLPALRKLLVGKQQEPSKRTSLVTFGGGGGGASSRSPSKGFRNPTDQGITFVSVHAPGNRDWQRLRDPGPSSSEEELEAGHGGIRAQYTYQVEMSRMSDRKGSGADDKSIERASGAPV